MNIRERLKKENIRISLKYYGSNDYATGWEASALIQNAPLFIECYKSTTVTVIDTIDDDLKNMAKGSTTIYGTGGMYTKVAAAEISTHAGADVAILDSSDVSIIQDFLASEDVGTVFTVDQSKDFDLLDFILNKKYLEN